MIYNGALLPLFWNPEIKVLIKLFQKFARSRGEEPSSPSAEGEMLFFGVSFCELFSASKKKHQSGAERANDEMPDQVRHDTVTIYTKKETGPYGPFLKAHWAEFDAVIFIGALGICIRSIASALLMHST